MKVVGVLPAAGHAARLQPLQGSKEMLQIGGRPVLDYAIDRMRAAEADEIRVVVRAEKTDVLGRAHELGLTVIEAEPATLAESILTAIDGLEVEDVVLLGLPDSIWEPRDGFKTLLAELSSGTDVALAVFHSPEPERGDVVELEEGDRVLRVHVKPSEPPGDLVWGAVAARAGALHSLSRHSQPGDLFDELARGGRVRAVRFPGEFMDIGTKQALRRARELFGS